jgi:hypothetical protein
MNILSEEVRDRAQSVIDRIKAEQEAEQEAKRQEEKRRNKELLKKIAEDIKSSVSPGFLEQVKVEFATEPLLHGGYKASAQIRLSDEHQLKISNLNLPRSLDQWRVEFPVLLDDGRWDTHKEHIYLSKLKVSLEEWIAVFLLEYEEQYAEYQKRLRKQEEERLAAEAKEKNRKQGEEQRRQEVEATDARIRRLIEEAIAPYHPCWTENFVLKVYEWSYCTGAHEGEFDYEKIFSLSPHMEHDQSVDKSFVVTVEGDRIALDPQIHKPVVQYLGSSLIRRIVKYLGSSLIRRIVRTPQPIRDTANNGCERVGGGNSPKLLSVAGWELLLLAPNWIQLLVVGVLLGLIGNWFLAMAKGNSSRHNELKDTYTQQLMSSITEIKQEQQLYQKLEELFAISSSDIENDEEDSAAISYLNKQIIQSLQEMSVVNPQENFVYWIEKKVDTFSLIRDYIDFYWNTIPKDKHIDLITMANILRTTLRDARYKERLDKDLYSFYQGTIFSFLYRLSDKLKLDNPDDYLCVYQDKDGNIIKEFPSSAEKKAVQRLKDLDDETQWISLPLEENEITDEEIEEYMKRRGLS